MHRKPWMFYFTDGGGDGAGGGGADGGGQDGDGQDGSGGEGFKPITSQADLDKLIGERVARERGKYADYKDLKAKAAKLAEIEEANKSELQKATDKATAAEQRAAAAEAALLRYRVAAKHGITDNDDIELFLTGTDEDTLTKQAKRLQERESKRGKPVRTREGSNPAGGGKSGDDELRQAAASLFGSPA